MTDTLEIIDLHAEIDGKEILKGVTLTIRKGETHAIMGPNGSGKSTLAMAIMGHPKYKVTKGKVLLDGEDMLALPTDQRARKGLFLGFQYPTEVEGVGLLSFLKTALADVSGKKVPILEFQKSLDEKMSSLSIDPQFASRSLNVGFSGGEKKRAEVLQLLVLKPRFAILDEMDSGLDIDSIKTVAKGIDSIRRDSGVLLITHYKRLLEHVRPDKVHVFADGRIALSGDASLADQLEEKGYDWLEEENQSVVE
ncbi:Fe-S cluster assembly ATPase SufC [Candidatus Micrarchaeota archaeon]|nr:Fe-S cluster assembly ATPase SufC [Candidatus Micrarchaeota archaeon]